MYIDLHCHPIPGVDDGARTPEEGAALLVGLRSIGFTRVIATPHIRSGVWDNRAATLAAPRIELEKALAALAARGTAVPTLEVAAEHLFDDVAYELFTRKEAMPYPGGRAALIEFPYDSVPHRVELSLWRLKRSGVTPVLAHPERYTKFYEPSERFEEVLGAGVKLLLDVMSLTGQYGRHSQAAAERMLHEGRYFAACSDAHKPSDVDKVAAAIEVLRKRVGPERAEAMLSSGPRSVLDAAP